MKLKELKHNHSLTDLLKILIFAILMLAPIGAVATRCMYVICNKNAYQSYSNYNANENQYVTIDSYDDLIEGRTYRVLTNNTHIGQDSNFGKIQCDNINLLNTNYQLTDEQKTNINNDTSFGFWYSTTNNTNYLKFTNVNVYFALNSNFAEFTFTFLGYTSIDRTNNFDYYFGSMIYYEEMIQQTNTLDNVFEYSVNELENSQLFNWTENTGVYTGVKAMTTQLEITGNVIPILITYWFLLTIIYVIIDIVLKLFTILTHMIGNKQA